MAKLLNEKKYDLARDSIWPVKLDLEIISDQFHKPGDESLKDRIDARQYLKYLRAFERINKKRNVIFSYEPEGLEGGFCFKFETRQTVSYGSFTVCDLYKGGRYLTAIIDYVKKSQIPLRKELVDIFSTTEGYRFKGARVKESAEEAVAIYEFIMQHQKYEGQFRINRLVVSQVRGDELSRVEEILQSNQPKQKEPPVADGPELLSSGDRLRESLDTLYLEPVLEAPITQPLELTGEFVETESEDDESSEFCDYGEQFEPEAPPPKYSNQFLKPKLTQVAQAIQHPPQAYKPNRWWG